MKKISILVAMSLSVIGLLILAHEQSEQKVMCENGICIIKKSENSTTTVKAEEAMSQEMNVIAVTVDNFDNVVKKATKFVVIDFYATWCPPCKQIKPIFSELAQEETDWVFATIDVDKAPTITASCGVQAMPTFVIFKDGIQWGSVQGALPKEQLMAEFKKIADMKAPMARTQAPQIQQLVLAICQNNFNEIKQLIADGVDVNGIWERPQGNSSILQTAIVAGTKKIIDLLLDSGAIMNKIIEESTKHEIETSEKMIETIQQSLEYAHNNIMALPAPIKRIATINNPELRQQFINAMRDPGMLNGLINEGADVNMVFEFGKTEATPLYLAIMLNNTTAIDILIQAGGSLTLEITDEQGCKQTVETMIKEDIKKYNKRVIKAREQLAYALNK